MCYKKWNKKKLTAIVCVGLMAGTLLPCGWAEAGEVTFDDDQNGVTPGGSFGEGVDLRWVKYLSDNDGIALANNAKHLIISFNGTKNKYFFGGFDDSNDILLTGYGVTLEKGTIDLLYGAYSIKGSANENVVTISGGTVEGSLGVVTNAVGSGTTAVIGGYVSASNNKDSTANGNRVTIENGIAINGDVYGGYSVSAERNTVTIKKGSTINGVVCGAYVTNGTVQKNGVIIEGGTLNKAVYGSATSTGILENNTVTIGGGTINNDIIGGVATGGNVTVQENRVTISGGTVTGNVYGGVIKSGSSHAKKNVVTISGTAEVGTVYGGYAALGSGSAEGNVVTISGGTVTGDVYGGYNAYSTAGVGVVTDNVVNLIGFGGKLEGKEELNQETSSIAGTVYGGGSKAAGRTVSGNQLNVYGTGTKVGNIANFDTINFYVPASAMDKDVMLNCTGSEETSLAGTTVNTGVESTSQLKKDEKIVLLKNEAKGIVTDTATKLDGKIEVGGWMEYDGTVALKNNNTELVLTLNKDMQPEEPPTPDPAPTPTPTPTPTPEPPKPDRLTENSKTFAETRAAEVSFLNNAADMVVGQGMLNAQSAAEAEEQAAGVGTNEATHSQAGFSPFAALGAASMRYETGSYVDSKGWGINVGMSRILHQEDGKTLLAPFLEYGKASYDSYLDNGVHGNGANQYFGVGVLARKDLNTGLYYEGSVRLGQMKGDYEGLDKYDTKSMYYALHAGIGKVVPVNDKSSMDYYGKLFYTHQNGDSVDLQKQYGEMDFDAINSFRTRLGFRYNHNVSEGSTFYTGLAWDYEFGSEARASYRGLSTPTPSMKGSSGLLEIGWKRPISEKNPVAIDVNLTGYAGKQRGISANVGLNWAF